MARTLTIDKRIHSLFHYIIIINSELQIIILTTFQLYYSNNFFLTCSGQLAVEKYTRLVLHLRMKCGVSITR